MEQIIVSVLCIVIGLLAFYGIVHVERMKRGFDKYIADCRAEQKRRALRNRAGLY